MSTIDVRVTDVVLVIDVSIAGPGADHATAQAINDKITDATLAAESEYEKHLADGMRSIAGHIAHIRVMPYADARKAKVFLVMRYDVDDAQGGGGCDDPGEGMESG